MKLTPKDVLAYIIVISCLVMIACGLDSWIKYTLLAVTSGYFGVDIIPAIRGKIGKKDNQEDP